MSSGGRTPSTRHASLRLQRRLDRVAMASALLSRKRSALVNQLFRTARPVLEAREAVEWQAAVAYAALLHAEADRGHGSLHALATPLRELRVELEPTEAWGLPGAAIVARDPVRRSAAERDLPLGPAGPATIATGTEFELLTELLLDGASRELLIRRLAHALAETSRRVNLLERRVAPALASEIRRIRSALEEREREEQLRYRRLMERPGRQRRI